jgi:hypothetical protein
MTVIARGRHRTGALAGIVLILVGAGALLLRQWGIDPIERIAQAGWPLFAILPGLALVTMAVIPVPPRGVGFAVAGSIVTSIGLLLWWQDQNDRFETWAYAWALIGPGAAGLAMFVYGALTRTADLTRQGIRLMAIAGALFLIGAWFFETVFATGHAPFDLEADLWWPLGLIAFGGLIVVGAFARSGEARDGKAGSSRPHRSSPRPPRGASGVSPGPAPTGSLPGCAVVSPPTSATTRCSCASPPSCLA